MSQVRSLPGVLLALLVALATASPGRAEVPGNRTVNTFRTELCSTLQNFADAHGLNLQKGELHLRARPDRVVAFAETGEFDRLGLDEFRRGRIAGILLLISPHTELYPSGFYRVKLTAGNTRNSTNNHRGQAALIDDSGHLFIERDAEINPIRKKNKRISHVRLSSQSLTLKIPGRDHVWRTRLPIAPDWEADVPEVQRSVSTRFLPETRRALSRLGSGVRAAASRYFSGEDAERGYRLSYTVRSRRFCAVAKANEANDHTWRDLITYHHFGWLSFDSGDSDDNRGVLDGIHELRIAWPEKLHGSSRQRRGIVRLRNPVTDSTVKLSAEYSTDRHSELRCIVDGPRVKLPWGGGLWSF